MGNLNKALAYELEALHTDEQIGNPYGLGISYNSLGGLYTRLGQFGKAEQFLKQGEATGEATGSRLLQMNNAWQWSAYYERRGDLRQALRQQKRYTTLHDSIFSDNSAGRLAELQALYEVEKKDEQIQALNTQRELHEDKIRLQHERLRLQNYIIVSVIVCFILVSLFAIKTYQYMRTMRRANREIMEQKEEIQAQSEELVEANQMIAENNRQLEMKVEERTSALRQAYQELDIFFYRSSHDFRRPLTTFLGLAEVAKITVKDTNALELFARVSETATNLDRMLTKLQSISDVGGQHLVYREVLVRDIFEALCDRFRDDLERKHIKVTAGVELTRPFCSYPAMVNVILENLLENSIFFCGVVDPFVRLHVYEQHDTVVIVMEDNGQGIDRQYHDRVFEMYFRGNERSKGNGLGLYIVQKAVQKLEGRIEFTSEVGVGSCFRVYLPMG
jgi:signal transduction histidine kinase